MSTLILLDVQRRSRKGATAAADVLPRPRLRFPWFISPRIATVVLLLLIVVVSCSATGSDLPDPPNYTPVGCL